LAASLISQVSGAAFFILTMENQLEKQSNLVPASFDRPTVKMTTGQTALLNLLKSKAESKEMISRKDIISFYIEHVKGGDIYKSYGSKPHPNPEYTYRVVDWDNFTLKRWSDQRNISSQALQWFRQNLGSCILKGKLLAIPVIEID
jgi:hypothetical protein